MIKGEVLFFLLLAVMSSRSAVVTAAVAEDTFPSLSAFDELRSAIVVSQLALSQNTLALQELLKITANTRTDHDCSCETEPPVSICPYPYTLVLNECFYVSPPELKLKWSQARDHCLGMEGDLATPEHVYALKSFYMGQGGSGRMWLGATDEGQEGVWRYLDNRSLPAHWNGGDNYNGNQDCLTIASTWHPPLDDIACSSVVHFACQYRPL